MNDKPAEIQALKLDYLSVNVTPRKWPWRFMFDIFPAVAGIVWAVGAAISLSVYTNHGT